MDQTQSDTLPMVPPSGSGRGGVGYGVGATGKGPSVEDGVSTERSHQKRGSVLHDVSGSTFSSPSNCTRKFPRS